MKVLAGLMMFVTMGVLGNAQTPATPPPAPEARVLGEIISNKGIKNAPFSADAVSESVQVLPDGNRIVRSSTSKMYRNSEGRFRQEITGGSGGMLGSFYSFGDGISVINPMGGSFSLDVGSKVARVFDGIAGQAITLAPTAPLAAIKPLEAIKLSPAVRAEFEAMKGKGNIDEKSLSPEARAEIEAFKRNAEKFKIDAEGFKVDAEKFKAAAEEMKGQLATTVVAGRSLLAPGFNSKWDTRPKSLANRTTKALQHTARVRSRPSPQGRSATNAPSRRFTKNGIRPNCR